MMCKIANAIIGGTYGAILSWNIIQSDYMTVIFAGIGWVVYLIYISTERE